MSELVVVLFSGGRGSGVLATWLARQREIDLTIAINGYDDGASTGEVRRFLGDSLGPSDFRKNASRLARELRSCPDALVEILDQRLPATADAVWARRAFRVIAGVAPQVQDQAGFERTAGSLAARLDAPSRAFLAGTLASFDAALRASGRPFDFGDCSVGNLVFAGVYLQSGRRFNAAVDAYCAALGLPAGLVDNVTDGTNAFLVGLDSGGRLLATESDIANTDRPTGVDDIFLLDRALTPEEIQELASIEPARARSALEARSVLPPLSPRLATRLDTANLIIYAPGTQHSSLFPSYLTRGLSEAIAGNVRAIKLLVTNLQSDAEISGRSAVDIIERAVFYLTRKHRIHVPTPFLMTSYLVNRSPLVGDEVAYVEPGPLARLEDLRPLVLENLEDGTTGRHDASKVVLPFVQALLRSRRAPRVALVLHDVKSAEKLARSLLEVARGGMLSLPLQVGAFYLRDEPVDAAALARLPFELHHVSSRGDANRSLRDELRRWNAEYIVLFESSGRYNAEDLVSLVSQLAFGRPDGVWGSRRLAVRDIRASYRERYRHHRVLGAISYVGSHLLSLTYLLFFGRYVSDTLSGVRAVRAGYLLDTDVDVNDRRLNHQLLAALLGDGAELVETPVQFIPVPTAINRVTVREGLGALIEIVRQRFRRRTPLRASRVTSSAELPQTESRQP